MRDRDEPAALSRRVLPTRNVEDFAWVPGLVVADPLANGDPP